MSTANTPLYNGRTAREFASDAEHSALRIAHLPKADKAPLSAGQIFGTLSGVTRVLEQIPEVITRMRAAVLHQHEAGNLAVTAGRFVDDPDAAAKALIYAVDEALAGFGSVRTNIEKAQAVLSEASFTADASGVQA